MKDESFEIYVASRFTDLMTLPVASETTSATVVDCKNSLWLIPQIMQIFSFLYDSDSEIEDVM